MTITLPSKPTFRTSRWRIISNAARFVSPINRVSQDVSRSGDFWACVLELPPMNYDRAANWAATLALMAGGRNSAYIPPPFRWDVGSPGTPRIKGAGQAGTSLDADGFTAGYTVRKGAFISYDTSTFRMLHIVTAAATANGSGEATISIMPAIRATPPDNAAINLSTPTCEMKLAEPDVDILNLTDPVTYGASLNLVEAVRE